MAPVQPLGESSMLGKPGTCTIGGFGDVTSSILDVKRSQQFCTRVSDVIRYVSGSEPRSSCFNFRCTSSPSISLLSRLVPSILMSSPTIRL